MQSTLKTLCIGLATATSLLLTATAIADEALAKNKNCLACHHISETRLGPAYKDVAAKYDNSDVANLVKKVKEGNIGKPNVWKTSFMPMPPNNVTDEEATKLVKWILSLK